MVISPNFKFLIKTKNEASAENSNNPERKLKTKKLRILNEFKKKVFHFRNFLFFWIFIKSFFLKFLVSWIFCFLKSFKNRHFPKISFSRKRIGTPVSWISPSPNTMSSKTNTVKVIANISWKSTKGGVTCNSPPVKSEKNLQTSPATPTVSSPNPPLNTVQIQSTTEEVL